MMKILNVNATPKQIINLMTNYQDGGIVKIIVRDLGDGEQEAIISVSKDNWIEEDSAASLSVLDNSGQDNG